MKLLTNSRLEAIGRILVGVLLPFLSKLLNKLLNKSLNMRLNCVVRTLVGAATVALILFWPQAQTAKARRHHSKAALRNTMYQAGQTALKNRRYPKAKKLFEAHLMAHPTGKQRHATLWGLGWIAIRTGRFAEAGAFFKTLIDEVPYGEHAPAALYWYGYGQQQRGKNQHARQLWAGLVKRFAGDYYAHRAEHQLGKRPWPTGKAILPPAKPTPLAQRIQKLLQRGRVQRAQKLLKQASPTTLHSQDPITTDTLIAYAQTLDMHGLAKRLQETRDRRFLAPDAATQARLAARFSSKHIPTLLGAAHTQKLDPHLLVALAKQESNLQANAISSAGALGLLQLMPATGREMFQALHRRRLRKSSWQKPKPTFDLLRPALNTRLGARYLAQMLHTFDNLPEYALAAYNAGPGRVAQWGRRGDAIPVDIFVEEIPYPETQAYVRRVLALRRVHRFLQNKKRPQRPQSAQGKTNR